MGKNNKNEEREYYSLENVPYEECCVKMEEGEEELFKEQDRNLSTPEDFYNAMKRSLMLVDVFNRAIGSLPGVSGFGDARLITVYVIPKFVEDEEAEIAFTIRLVKEGQLRMYMDIKDEEVGRYGDFEGDFEEQLHKAAERLSKIVNEDFFEVKEISLLGD